MIDSASIIKWHNKAPWPLDEQIEQDLIISRAIVEIYSDPLLKKELNGEPWGLVNKLESLFK